VVATNKCPTNILKKQDGVLLCYDSTKEKTLKAVKKTKREKIDATKRQPPCLLVGLKTDERKKLFDESNCEDVRIKNLRKCAV
jgi:GTPase SAR1 family protein